MTHTFDWNTDRCKCGGVVVYFEPDDNGTFGEGCEVSGVVWQEAAVRKAALWAYDNLEGLPEFGEEMRVAIIDTAGDKLTDEGVDFDRALLRRIAKELAG